MFEELKIMVVNCYYSRQSEIESVRINEEPTSDELNPNNH